MGVGWQDVVELVAEGAGVVGALVRGVAGQALLRVDPGGWAGPRDAVDHGEVPDAEMDQGVVVSADQGETGDVGSAAVAPPDDVVGFTPLGWRGAPRNRASAISGVQRSALGSADGTHVAAEVQDRAAGGE